MGAELDSVFLCPSMLPVGSYGLMRSRLESTGVPTLTVAKAQFERLSVSREPSGVLIVARQAWQALPPEVGRDDLWVGIEHLRTAGNVGSILRSAAAAGARGLMVFGPERDRTDVYDLLAVRASMGAIFRLSIVATSHAEFRRWRLGLARPIATYGGTGEAELDYRAADCRGPTLLMLGNERSGLSDAQRATCDTLVRIPMAPGTDSLNVAMAATVLLFEAAGQRSPISSADVGP